jgi:hypothetical protein
MPRTAVMGPACASVTSSTRDSSFTSRRTYVVTHGVNYAVLAR